MEEQKFLEQLREIALCTNILPYIQEKIRDENQSKLVTKFVICLIRECLSYEDCFKRLSKQMDANLIQKIYNIVKTHDSFSIPIDSVVFAEEKAKSHKDDAILPVIGSILKGRVISVTSTGVYLVIDNFRGRPKGFLPEREFTAEYGLNVKINDRVSVGQILYVKLMDIQDQNLYFSIQGVNQSTGVDILNTTNMKYSRAGLLKTTMADPGDDFDLGQMYKAGVLSTDDVSFFKSTSLSNSNGQTEEYFEIVVNDTLPQFLKVLSDYKQEIDPRIVQKNPKGSLYRAAKNAASSTMDRIRRRNEDPSSRGNIVGLLDDETPSVVTNAKINKLPEWKQQTFARFGPTSNIPKKLPIEDYKDKILEKVMNNRVFILIGETGSGKTTQLPKYLNQWGISDRMIAVTQPRRVAAISVSKRVSQEMSVPLGGLVGYSVRFEEKTSSETKIKFLTDGMLLRECLSDRLLSNYGVVMLDEAHERTIHTDVLFGLMKELLEKRKDIKVIVTSATLQRDKFSKFFFNCPILDIPGRTYPVSSIFATEPFEDYLQASINSVLRLHETEEMPGDILLFLTGQEDIDTACEIIYNQSKSMESRCGKLIVLPIYSSLPTEQQTMIFEPTPPGQRKVVVATNIAETSITIDGIRFVVDPGLVKEMRYDPSTGMSSLSVVPISRAAANQRKGRAGRTSEGKCVRLYTEDAFLHEMAETTQPEIQRADMVTVALQLKVLGIDDLISFDFMDKPPIPIIIDSLRQLFVLGALDEEGNLTPLGVKMAQFPLLPQLSKTLIKSSELECSEEVLIIVSLLSVQGIWHRPRKKQQEADAMKARFNKEEGDHITLLHVYREWTKNGRDNKWCMENYIHKRALDKAEDIMAQLQNYMTSYGLQIASAGNDIERILKAFVSGFFAKAARRNSNSDYRTLVDNKPVALFPGSALYEHTPDYLVYHELVNTTKEYIRNSISVQPQWLIELAPFFYRKASPTEMTKRKITERLQHIKNIKNKNESDWKITYRRVIHL